ncbi:acyl-CoA synthetase [Marinobacter litoralis]|uniref:acyl-CoA synthetase n=1 Tax=Marinobacter litoralis TaxID=187981 RepID=UPI0018EDB834|nr:acyl-CoA synthetase [Marinobacter litoralis]MBJ6136084.1 AMP-binding protein [Marinobacter litoralis]
MITQKQNKRTLTGIVCGDQHLSHEEFQSDIKRAASGLKQAGIEPGDCVAIFMRNDIPFLTVSRATAYIGGYAVPVNWHLVGEELTYILDDCAAKILVIHADLWRKVRNEIPEDVKCILVETPKALSDAFGIAPENCTVPSDQIAFAEWLAASDPIADPPREGPSSMIYTSGTTGHPKGVRRTPLDPENARVMQEFRSRVYGCKEGARAIVPGPLYHSAPNSFGMQASKISDVLVIVPRFDAESFLATVEDYAITAAIMVPIMFIRLLKLPDDVRNKYYVSSIEFVVHAAAPCPADVKTRMIKWFGPVINEFYGSTESGAVTACTSEQALLKPGTVGKTVPEADVRILDPEGNILPAGQVGEIYSRFPNMDFTYNRKPEERAAIDRDGYITSGDMGYFDEDGFLFIADRVKDMIISGGVNIYPAEIEEVLHNCPGIKDCAVFGIPDEEFGESVMAVIETDDGNKIDVQNVEVYLREHLAGYKVPRRIEVGRDLPREDSGKIFKRRLRDKYWQSAGRSI